MIRTTLPAALATGLAMPSVQAAGCRWNQRA